MSILSKNQIRKVVVNAGSHGYKPDVTVFKAGRPVQIKSIPSDNIGCTNEIVFEDLGVDRTLDDKKEIIVDIPTDKSGIYNLACGMDILYGKVVVK